MAEGESKGGGNMLGQLEKRRIIRWKIQKPVRFKLDDQEEEKIALLKDVSFFGAQISSLDNLRLDDKLDMVLEIPDEDNPISCQGKVVWQNVCEEAGKSHFNCGLSFTQIKDNDREKIFNYVWSTAPEDLKKKWWDGVK